MKKGRQSLAPGFLIASPPLGDPNFDRTVVLLAVHNEDGALGFVINRPAPMSLGEVLNLAGYRGPETNDRGVVFLGGPVSPSMGWILCRDPSLEAEQEGVLVVDDRIRVTSRRSAFDDLVQDRNALAGEVDPKRRFVVLGYSGWGPGQLEKEISAGAWMPSALDEGVLFDVDVEQRWERAYALIGLSPLVMMSMRGGGAA